MNRTGFNNDLKFQTGLSSPRVSCKLAHWEKEMRSKLPHFSPNKTGHAACLVSGSPAPSWWRLYQNMAVPWKKENRNLALHWKNIINIYFSRMRNFSRQSTFSTNQIFFQHHTLDQVETWYNETNEFSSQATLA